MQHVFNPIPIVRPRHGQETQWIQRYEDPRKIELRRQLLADHFASVADYWGHKARHPNSHAGSMVLLYNWSPYIIAATTLVAGGLMANPIVVVAGWSAWREIYRRHVTSSAVR